MKDTREKLEQIVRASMRTCEDRGEPYPAHLQAAIDQLAIRGPSLDQILEELKSAGWKKVNARVWKSPDLGYFRGPYGAWKEMKRAAQQVGEVKP